MMGYIETLYNKWDMNGIILMVYEWDSNGIILMRCQDRYGDFHSHGNTPKIFVFFCWGKAYLEMDEDQGYPDLRKPAY